MKVLTSTLLVLGLTVSSAAMAEKPTLPGQGIVEGVKNALTSESDEKREAMEKDVANAKEEAANKMEQVQEEKAKAESALEEKKQAVSEQAGEELDKGVEAGNAVVEEQSKAWWKFWE